MVYNYENKVAIITGASSGFGRSLARKLVEKGTNVVLGDVDMKASKAVVEELEKIRKGSAAFTKCDVTKKADQRALFSLAIKAFGTIDIVVNNAGIADYTDFYTDDGNDNWVKVLDIDLNAVILGTRLAFDFFAHKGKKPGIILNTASLAGLYPQPAQPSYSVAKAGVVQLSRSVAMAGANYGIHCIPICPSFSPTALLEKGAKVLGEGFIQSTSDQVPVETVIDAFILAIDKSEKLNGRPIRITSQRGIDVYTFGQGKPFKL